MPTMNRMPPKLILVLSVLCALCSNSPCRATGLPVLENASFESPPLEKGRESSSNAACWFHFSTPAGGARGITSKRSRSGQQSFYFKAQQQTNAYQALVQKLPVEANTKYSFSAYVINDETNPLTGRCKIQLSIEWKDANGREIRRTWGSPLSSKLSSRQWRQLVVQGEAPRGAVYCHTVITLFSRDSDASGVFYVDDTDFHIPALSPHIANGDFETAQLRSNVATNLLPREWIYFASEPEMESSLSREKKRSGSQSVHFIAPRITNGFHGLTQASPVIPGRQYAFTIYALGDSNRSRASASFGQISLEWKDSHDQEIGRTWGPTWNHQLSPTAWSCFTVEGKAPNHAAYCLCTITCFSRDSTNEIAFYVDDAEFSCLDGRVTETSDMYTSIRAENRSVKTDCAEHDNVNIPLFGSVTSFVIEATHPHYPVHEDNCVANFENCPPPVRPYSFHPAVYKLFDDNTTVFEAVREASWRLPHGMTVYVDNGKFVQDIHYVRLYRKISQKEKEWPQFLVMYMDGNLRLILFPSRQRLKTCFGSSVLIGPAPAVKGRPIAEVSYLRFLPEFMAFRVMYKTGGSAFVKVDEVNRHLARVRVDVGYPVQTHPFATFRSMFVKDGNCDVDHVRWNDPENGMHGGVPIMAFTEGVGTDWFFFRKHRSRHNTSAPDIRIGLPR